MRKIVRLSILVLFCIILNNTKVFASKNQIPKVYFEGNITNMQTKTDERMITLKYRSDNLNFDTYTKIKVQGTSSLAYEKKNYTINMYKDSGYSEKSKIDMGKGWGKQSKYCFKNTFYYWMFTSRFSLLFLLPFFTLFAY